MSNKDIDKPNIIYKISGGDLHIEEIVSARGTHKGRWHGIIRGINEKNISIDCTCKDGNNTYLLDIKATGMECTLYVHRGVDLSSYSKISEGKLDAIARFAQDVLHGTDSTGTI